MGHSTILGRIADDFQDRVGRGERPDVEEYAARHPELADVLRDVLPLLAEATPDDTEPTSPASATATAIPGYEVLGELGRGGMGVVYKARQAALNRVVALKVIRSADLAGDAERRRFLAEAEAVARLRHPGIVQVYDYGESDGRPYFSMEYVTGGTLAGHLAGGPMPPRAAAALVAELARAVRHAHAAGVVHRDLKPANVLIDPAQGSVGGLKVTDFGLARTEDSNLTASGAIVGTPSYMAPEQTEGRPAGPGCDIWALGVILYECLTGRVPFRGAAVMETLDLVRAREPVPPRQLQPSVPRDLETVCLKCLEKDPARRYAGAAELVDDLRRFLDGRPVVARPVSALGRAWRWCRRNPAVAVLLAGTVSLLAVIAVGATLTALELRANVLAITEAEGKARGERDRAVAAEADAEDKFWRGLADQADVRAGTGRPGQRFETLSLLRRAAEVARKRSAPAEDFARLRGIAAVALSLPDIRAVGPNTLGPDDAKAGAVDLARGRHARADPDGSIIVKSLGDGLEWARVPARRRPGAMQFSPDGSRLAVTGTAGGFVWDFDRSREVFALPAGAMRPSFSADGNRVAVYSARELVVLEAGGVAARFATLEPSMFALSPDGETVAATFLRGVEDVRVFARRDGKGWSARSPSPTPLTRVVWHPSGQWLLAWNSSGEFYSAPRSVAHFTPARPPTVGTGGFAVGIGADGAVLRVGEEAAAATDFGRVSVFLDGVRPFALNGGRFLTGVGDEGSGAVWEASLGGVSAPWPAGAAPHPSLRFAAVPNSKGVSLIQPDGQPLAELAVGQTGQVAFTDSGESLITAGTWGAYLWPIRGVRIGPPVRLPSGWSAAEVKLAPGGREAIVLDGKAQPMRLDPPEVIGDPWPHSRRSHEPAIGPGGQWVVAGDVGTGLHLQLADGPSVPIPVGPGQVRATVSPDGRRLLTATATEFILWEVGRWDRSVRRWERRGRGNDPGAAAFDPSGRWLALELAAPSVDVIDLLTLDPLIRLSPPGVRLPTAAPSPLMFPSGSHLVAVGRLWDLGRLRDSLREIGLDWEGDSSRFAGREPPAERVEIDLGGFRAEFPPGEGREFAKEAAKISARVKAAERTGRGFGGDLLLRARMHLTQGEFDMALVDADAALAAKSAAVAPNPFAALLRVPQTYHAVRGRALAGCGRSDEAFKAFEASLGTELRNPEALIGLALLHADGPAKFRDPERAVRLAAEASTRLAVEAWVRLAAEAWIRLAAESSKRDAPEAAFVHGLALYRAGRFAEARELLLWATVRSSYLDYGRAMYFLAAAEARSGVDPRASREAADRWRATYAASLSPAQRSVLDTAAQEVPEGLTVPPRPAP